MNRTQVQFWYNRCKEGRQDVNDNACSGRLSTSTTDGNIEALKKMISGNRFSEYFRRETCYNEDYFKIANFKQKQHRKDNAQEMLMTINDDSDLLKNVITVDDG